MFSRRPASEALATRLEELSARTTTEGEGEAGDATSTVLTDLGHGVFATAAMRVFLHE